MKDESLRKLACDLSNKIYVNAPWNAKLPADTTNLIYEALKIVDHDRAAQRLEALTLISTFRRSPSICSLMSGIRLSEHQMIEMLDRMYELLKMNLPEIECFNEVLNKKK